MQGADTRTEAQKHLADSAAQQCDSRTRRRQSAKHCTLARNPRNTVIGPYLFQMIRRDWRSLKGTITYPLSLPAICSNSASQGNDHALIGKAQRRKMRANRIGDIAWRKMRIVLLGHPGILMAKLRRDHAERNAPHSEH